MGAEPAARLGSMVMGRPTTFAAQMIEIGGLSWENSNFASIDLVFLKRACDPEISRDQHISQHDVINLG